MKNNTKTVNLKMTLGFNITRVSILYRRELIRCFKEYNITPEQWQVLVSLWAKGSLNQVEISEITCQDAPTISRMIKRMEKNGLIKKNIDEKDARITNIELTTQGKQLEKKLPDKLIIHFDKVLKKYPKFKQDQLLQLLLEIKSCFE
jgi:DNA-binding MarR family transcriptional regulator